MSNFWPLFLLMPLTALAQEEDTFPKDTSYTVQSTYRKVKKEYPFAEIVLPALPEGVAEEKNVTYRTLGNRELRADIFYPSDSGQQYPGVLLVHGGGWRTGDRSLLIPIAHQLADNGYVAVCVEYRLSLEAAYPAAVHDLKAAVRWMRSEASAYSIDTSKIAVLGCSAGGQLAALIGTANGLSTMEGGINNGKFSSAAHAIVDIDGILAFKHPESEEGAMAAQWLGGTYEEAPENWNEASALSHVDEDTPPILFIGSSFSRFLAGRDDMIEVLETNNIYWESYIIADSPHSFWLFHPWFEPTVDYTIGFLNKVFNQK